ncbi:hypothetical protein BDY17DRAFT_69612 [Neohortaea acidophila]|uniref:Uncharacterized protein n=1 Tax=Neohortaea acidophila TaxID=245834 RepID=A0A6A6Q0T5_9PEZI|nr:uncharacterized protein BDY17DRAFT_69612 [Neohortaea acidophila]KAF2486020.1 hypothetical protein BDY17DRAFT_69612 [Neohortaea acidophila]
MSDREGAKGKDAKTSEATEGTEVREDVEGGLVYSSETMQRTSIFNSGAVGFPATQTQVDVESTRSADASSPASVQLATTDNKDYGIQEEDDSDEEDGDDEEDDDSEEDGYSEEGGVGIQQSPPRASRLSILAPMLYSARYYADLNRGSGGHDSASEDDEEITLGSSDSDETASPSPTPSQDSTAQIVVAPATIGPLQICEHTTWCHCPRDEATDPDNIFLHLSEYALNRMEWPMLADRSTQKIPLPEHELTKIHVVPRVNEAQRSSDVVRSKLPVIGFDSTEDLKQAARTLVAEINHHFPPAFVTDDTYYAPMIVHVRDVITQWFRDMDYEALERKFAELVGDKKDLMHLFQKFLLPRLKTISLAESGLEEKDEAQKAVQAMVDELDSAHHVQSC